MAFTCVKFMRPVAIVIWKKPELLKYRQFEESIAKESSGKQAPGEPKPTGSGDDNQMRQTHSMAFHAAINSQSPQRRHRARMSLAACRWLSHHSVPKRGRGVMRLDEIWEIFGGTVRSGR